MRDVQHRYLITYSWTNGKETDIALREFDDFEEATSNARAMLSVPMFCRVKVKTIAYKMIAESSEEVRWVWVIHADINGQSS